MSKNAELSFIDNMLESVGITVNGSSPADIQIYNKKFYQRVVKQGALGLGESYMEKWWDVQDLDVFFERLLRAQLDTKLNIPMRFLLKQIFSRFINFQTRIGSKKVGEHHYDLGNDLFTKMLDSNMQYSCGYWKSATTLEEAQTAKLDLICKKLELKPGMRLLDIGCGWGGLMKFAAQHYGIEAVGITISKEQSDFAKIFCKDLPIDIRLQDYRDNKEKFDRIVSVGMFEHVGHLNYKTYMKTAHHNLKDDGLFLLHTIGVNEHSPLPNEWITKYVFPNGALPTIEQIAKSFEKQFVLEDWHCFGADYDPTLMAWHDNFEKHWDEFKTNYGDRFYRMWKYYLLSCAGSFRARSIQLWQLVLSKNGVRGGYVSVR